MNTQVVNVKVANIRPTYNNLQAWMNNSNNIYIGRKGIVFVEGKRFPTKDSMWHNPYKITEQMNRNDVLAMYKVYIEKKINSDEKINGKTYLEHLLLLRGKNLGCWCAPEACHGDILIELINKYGGDS